MKENECEKFDSGSNLKSISTDAALGGSLMFSTHFVCVGSEDPRGKRAEVEC